MSAVRQRSWTRNHKKLYHPSFISKLFYAVLLSPLQPKQSTLIRPQFALFPDNPGYRRAISTIKLVDGAVPGIADRSSRWMYKNNRFPWAQIDVELIAYGSGAAVLRLNWEHGDKVLRIYQKSIGKSACGLLEIAKYYKRNYETVLSWYGSSLDLILPMEFLVLEGLPLIGPVAASLQPYIHGEKQDLFQDFSDHELSSLLGANGFLREQFIFFAQQTLHQWIERKRCYDFLGRENVMLVKEGADYRIQVADAGIFNLEILANASPGKMSQLGKCMDRLASLYRLAREI